MNKIVILLLIICPVFSFGQKIDTDHNPNRIFELSIGLQYQTFIHNENIKGVWSRQRGPYGDNSYKGLGIPIEGVLHFIKFDQLSLSLTPVVRYALIELPSSYDINTGNAIPSDRKWGFTVDTHLTLHYKFKSKNWLIKNSKLGAGLSIINVGRSFDTYYEWSFNSAYMPLYTHQAKTLMFYGIHGQVEKEFFNRLDARFMVIYSSGNWIDYDPYFIYTIKWNVSLQYQIFEKSIKQRE